MGIVSGGSQPQTVTATVTTGLTTFVAEHFFDLARTAAVSWVATITAITPDGEVFDGTHLGVTSEDISGNGPSFTSLDGITYFAAGSSSAELSHAFTVNDKGWAALVTPRYLKTCAQIVDQNGNPYAGANHPRVTVRFDIEYL